MVKDWWKELWSPDNRIWQFVDRFLFVLLPIIALYLFLVPNTPQDWKDIMSNLLWIIPLGAWILLSLTVIPLKLAGKYKKKYLEAEKRILELEKPTPNRAPPIRLIPQHKVKKVVHRTETVDGKTKYIDEIELIP